MRKKERTFTDTQRAQAVSRTRIWRMRTKGIVSTQTTYPCGWKPLNSTRRAALFLTDSYVKGMMKVKSEDPGLINERRLELFSRRIVHYLIYNFDQRVRKRKKIKAVKFLLLQGLKTCCACNKTMRVSEAFTLRSGGRSKWAKATCNECRTKEAREEAESMSEKYINHLLNYGLKTKVQFPKSMIEVKRVSLSIKREIKKRKTKWKRDKKQTY